MKSRLHLPRQEPLRHMSYPVLQGLVLAWHAWQSPSDAGQERAARLLQKHCKGVGERALFLALRGKIPEVQYEEFDAMYRFWEEWQGCE